jgi:hypothetical protein
MEDKIKITNPYKKENPIKLAYQLRLDDFTLSNLEDEDRPLEDYTKSKDSVYKQKQYPIESIVLLKMRDPAKDDSFDIILIRRKGQIQAEIWLGYWNEGTYNQVH